MSKKQYTFYFDSSNCSGCKACQIACKDKNNLPLSVLWRRVYEVGSGGWVQKDDAWINDIRTYNMSVACNHCEEPVCVDVCPTKAMAKDKNGIVTIDEKRCIGCKYCEWVCPYGAPQFNESTGLMTKCNFCTDYISEGKNPSCVDACPMRVLEFGELKELKKKHGVESEVFPFPKEHYTKPAIIIKKHSKVIEVDDTSASIFNEEEV